MNWKKRENRYLGSKSISDKEAKEQDELDKSKKIDQYLNRFPENEKYLGFENVSFFIVLPFISIFLITFRIQTFVTQTLPFKSFTIVCHSESKS